MAHSARIAPVLGRFTIAKSHARAPRVVLLCLGRRNELSRAEATRLVPSWPQRNHLAKGRDVELWF
ncbi:hypothetical protein WKW77_09250 [Variovorax ureilyticus]|uniref:Uncharacterized protein n=1 Tax=Variovorax ureilyticus TaxID=1836198 RepID=A0ABU8VC60_9BURK